MSREKYEIPMDRLDEIAGGRLTAHAYGWYNRNKQNLMDQKADVAAFGASLYSTLYGITKTPDEVAAALVEGVADPLIASEDLIGLEDLKDAFTDAGYNVADLF